MDCVKLRFGREEDLSDISSWSSKNFTCSFCKREFKSAQALGGHMNVHRRDRARLRLLPPNLILSSSSSSEYSPYPNPKPSPNPKSYFSSSSLPSSSSSLSGANRYFPQLLSTSGSTYMSTPSSGTSDHKNRKLMIFDSGSHQHRVPAFLNPNKGIMRGSALDYEAGDQLNGFSGFAQKHHLDDDFKALKEDKKHINMIRVDLNMGLRIKDPNYKEEVDLELRLGHL
ncbi:hypothetical protein M0R45_010676 [Rubus argutus]|uniref:C2H2-type domain-containing protein n=1 Tax=Rubus argutus TaxID=59490 RepID=A0AAW1Y8K1_RUBAR